MAEGAGKQEDKQVQVVCKHEWDYAGTSGVICIMKCKKCGATREGGIDPMNVAAIIAGCY